MPKNEWNQPNYWLSVILLSDVDTNMLMDEMDKANISKARPVWKPMHLQPIFAEYDYVGNNVAETLFNTDVCLPSDTKMTDEDLSRVVKTIKRVLQHE